MSLQICTVEDEGLGVNFLEKRWPGNDEAWQHPRKQLETIEFWVPYSDVLHHYQDFELVGKGRHAYYILKMD